MNNLLQRTLSGAIFVALVAGSILWCPYAFGGVFVLAAALAVREFHRLSNRQDQEVNVPPAVGMAGAALLFACSYLYASGTLPGIIYAAYGVYVAAVMVAELFRKPVHGNGFRQMGSKIVPDQIDQLRMAFFRVAPGAEARQLDQKLQKMQPDQIFRIHIPGEKLLLHPPDQRKNPAVRIQKMQKIMVQRTVRGRIENIEKMVRVVNPRQPVRDKRAEKKNVVEPDLLRQMIGREIVRMNDPDKTGRERIGFPVDQQGPAPFQNVKDLVKFPLSDPGASRRELFRCIACLFHHEVGKGVVEKILDRVNPVAHGVPLLLHSAGFTIQSFPRSVKTG